MWKPSVLLHRASRRPPITTTLLASASLSNCLCRNGSPSSAPSSSTSSTAHRRAFHEYFVTHIPSSSLHPDSGNQGPHHKLPRDKSTPHPSNASSSRSPAASLGPGSSREMTVVRIPLKNAKHHFGVSLSRGVRPYNEDAFQAGTVDVPAFAKRRPVSLTRNPRGGGLSEAKGASGESGDPQVFYFGVFDGHGGMECSGFLREQLHTYVESATKVFKLESSLNVKRRDVGWPSSLDERGDKSDNSKSAEKRDATDLRKKGKETLDAIETHTPPGVEPIKPPTPGTSEELPPAGKQNGTELMDSAPPVKQSASIRTAEDLELTLVKDWKELVGGYFRRFKPEYFSLTAGGRGHPTEKDVISKRHSPNSSISDDAAEGIGIETVLSYAFLKADYDFVSAQVNKQSEDPVAADRALNADDILGRPSQSPPSIGGKTRFKGGSTCSIALISTPTPTPFWHPAAPSTLIVAHVGDTRILLCKTATGLAVPLTSNHHPSLPEEATRLRRYAATFVTDSFGEERVSGLANTRSFGDYPSKRIGVSAEPEIRRVELEPSEYSFLVLISDGVSGHLSDQEIVDIVKEAKTPEQAARDVTSYAVEVAVGGDADNATCLVVRLGGWERRGEGGLGSLGTKEMRDWRMGEAENPRGRT